MTNNDELALKLKQTAQLVHDNEQISNYGKLEAWKVRFRHTASPANILALLAERDANKKQLESWRGLAKQNIAEHEKAVIALDAARLRICELETVSAAAEKLVRCKGRYRSEQNYRALAALFGVSTPDLPPIEAEARTVTHDVGVMNIGNPYCEDHLVAWTVTGKQLAAGIYYLDARRVGDHGLEVGE